MDMDVKGMLIDGLIGMNFNEFLKLWICIVCEFMLLGFLGVSEVYFYVLFVSYFVSVKLFKLFWCWFCLCECGLFFLGLLWRFFCCWFDLFV